MPLCPQCGEEVSATDTHCMDCGADLIAAREKERRELREQSMASRAGSGSVAVPANAAAAGLVSAGDKPSEETRLKTFDRQAAAVIAEDRKTFWVLSVIALVAGIALAIAGLTRIGAGGGFGEVLASLKPGAIRDLSFGALVDPTILGVLLLGGGLGAVCVGVGQMRMALAAGRAIEDVKRGQKPEIVVISSFVTIGMYLLSVFLSPVAFVVGVVLFLRGDPDAKGLGSSVCLISLVLMALFGLNLLWTVFDSMRPAPGVKAK